MTFQNKEIALRSDLAQLNAAGILTELVEGGVIRVNDRSHFGAARGKSIANRVGKIVNRICTNYDGGLTRINAADTDIANGTVKIKPEYQKQFAEAVEQYRIVE